MKRSGIFAMILAGAMIVGVSSMHTYADETETTPEVATAVEDAAVEDALLVAVNDATAEDDTVSEEAVVATQVTVATAATPVTTAVSASGDGSPKTGDMVPIAGAMAGLVAAATGIYLSVCKKDKE